MFEIHKHSLSWLKAVYLLCLQIYTFSSKDTQSSRLLGRIFQYIFCRSGRAYRIVNIILYFCLDFGNFLTG